MSTAELQEEIQRLHAERAVMKTELSRLKSLVNGYEAVCASYHIALGELHQVLVRE